jgi:hypothetical protein
VMGPISVELKEHHQEPTLDPSALVSNLTRGAYGALPLAVITLTGKPSPDEFAANVSGHSNVDVDKHPDAWISPNRFLCAHRSQLSPEEFNRIVAENQPVSQQAAAGKGIRRAVRCRRSAEGCAVSAALATVHAA